ncbi:dienelactone hydrolase family protein [Dehalococcoidia bacterium]|nr:dienelactone hydrolase family protein [Dehalococcoidia bacterium]
MGVSVTEIRDNGLVASFCLPGTTGKHPGVIVLGGSEGGKDAAIPTAKLLAEQGYAALVLAYFGVEQLPQKLEEIPLEYFKQAIDWMASNPSVESRRIGLIGTSRGGEAALLVSATYPEISAVVAYVPSDVVFQGINYSWSRERSLKSAWTLHGQPLPFVPFVYSFRLMWRHGFLLASYLGGLQDQEAVERAIIPVERINGPILLISGKEDRVSPSTMACNRIVERLSQHNFPFPFEHLSYEDAGHIPPCTMEVLMEERRTRRRGFRLSFKNLFSLLFIRAGGTKTGNAFAIDDAWAKTCAFLEQHLKR